MIKKKLEDGGLDFEGRGSGKLLSLKIRVAIRLSVARVYKLVR